MGRDAWLGGLGFSAQRLEHGQQRRFASIAEDDNAGIPYPFRPAEFLDSCQQRRAERASQVMPALAPIEAGPAKRALCTSKRVRIYA